MMHAVRQQHSMLQDALSNEGLRRKTESHKLQYGQTLVDGIVAKIHATFLLDRDGLERLKLVGDYGTTISLKAAQPKPGSDRADLDGIELCLTQMGLSVRLGPRLYPVDLQLLATPPGDDGPGCLTIQYKRCPPHKASIEATFDLDTEPEMVLAEFYKHLVKHVQTI